jgi:hypothetical protein
MIIVHDKEIEHSKAHLIGKNKTYLNWRNKMRQVSLTLIVKASNLRGIITLINNIYLIV